MTKYKIVVRVPAYHNADQSVDDEADADRLVGRNSRFTEIRISAGRFSDLKVGFHNILHVFCDATKSLLILCESQRSTSATCTITTMYHCTNVSHHDFRNMFRQCRMMDIYYIYDNICTTTGFIKLQFTFESISIPSYFTRCLY